MTVKMTKGNFETLAYHLRYGWPPRDEEAERFGYQAAITAVADACEASSNFTPNGNRAFDRARFLAACEDA